MLLLFWDAHTVNLARMEGRCVRAQKEPRGSWVECSFASEPLCVSLLQNVPSLEEGVQGQTGRWL